MKNTPTKQSEPLTRRQVQRRLHKAIALREQARDLYMEMDSIIEDISVSDHRDLKIVINGTYFGLIDRYATKNVAFKATAIRRFDIGPIKKRQRFEEVASPAIPMKTVADTASRRTGQL